MVSPTEALSIAITETMLELNLTRFEDLNINLFTQWWGSTALGFTGSIGGQAFTKATTIILEYEKEYFVYFNTRFAYKVTNPTQLFFDDAKNSNLVSTGQYEKRYIREDVQES